MGDILNSNSLKLLKELANLKNEDEQRAFIFKYPILLSKKLQNLLFNKLSSVEADERARLKVILEYLQALRKRLEKNLHEYPIGLGPIEQLWARLGGGEIKFNHAEELAQKRDITSLLAPVYVQALSNFTSNYSLNGGWEQAAQMQQLLLAAVHGMPDSEEADIMREQTDFDWIEIAGVFVWHIPDGRIYRSAITAGERVIERGKKTGNNDLLGGVLHRLGTLNLDPYTAGRSSMNYPQQIINWEQGLLDYLGAEFYSIPENEIKMPIPEEALQIAEKYYRQALNFRKGHSKGLTLKALIQAIEWQSIVFGKEIDQEEIVHLCQQALDLLNPTLDPHQRLDVLSTLNSYKSIDIELKTLLPFSLDESIRQLGILNTITLVSKASEILKKDNPLLSLDLLRNAHSFFDQYGDEKHRVNILWQNEIMLISQISALELPAKLPNGGLAVIAQEIYQQAKNYKWDVQKLCASFIFLAAYSYKWNEEAVGLSLLHKAKQIAPIFTRDYVDALAYLSGTLNLGVAVNEVNNGNWAASINAYAIALRQYLDLNLVDTSLDCLRRINDLSSRGDYKVGEQVVIGLAPLVLSLETKIGERAARLIQKICKRTLANMSAQAINPEVLLFLMQISKGLRFATALYAGSRYRWREDESGALMLKKIKEAESALPPDSPAIKPYDMDALLDEDTILTSSTLSRFQQSGDSPEEQLNNLQQKYDVHLIERILSDTRGDEALYFSSMDIQAALDDRSVLLIFYLGATRDGRIGLYSLAITRDDFRASLVKHEFPDSEVFLGDGERQVKVNPFALTIQAIRKSIEGPPGFDDLHFVTREAGKILETDLRGYLGHFVEYLDELHKAGKDHLCIVPHGPLHYYPFHLLGKPGKPLADKWKITYLPNLHLFTSSRGLPAARRFRKKAITAIGISFKKINPFGLEPIPESLSESKKIAEIFGRKAIPDEQATEKTFLNALKNSRFVHLSTHGRHNANAPAFQCLYMTPDDQSDGRLYAHELLSLDLRGLEVLTLGACETALGRFDIGDNLRGLPATLLLAGVATIIGTLWNVEPNASECFFTSFYSELKAGSTRLDAFAKAQSETRKAFPEYRDWGPFYLIGEWS